MPAALRVFVLFALGYFVSYVYRGVNLGFAPYLTHEMGLSGADLGLLTSLYFLGFASAQLPVGILLDRFGSRRVTAILILIAAAGSAIFGMAHGKTGLMIGRLLIGVGLSACLGAAFKALAQWYEVKRLPLVNGLTMAVGGLGGVAMGSPLLWLLSKTDWRSVCLGLSVFSVAVALAIWFAVPSSKEVSTRTEFRTQLAGTWQVLRSGVFWRIAAFSSLTQAVFYTMQSLWVAPWLRDVNGLSAQDAGRVISILGVAMVVGSVGFGFLARSLEHRGVSVRTFSGLGMLVFVLIQALIMLQIPVPAWVLWTGYGLFGGCGILSYAVLVEHFPLNLIGRVNTSLTLVIFVLIFFGQVAVGAVLDFWPVVNGHYPPVAHLTAWGILLALQLLAAIWYFAPKPKVISLHIYG
ncbi:MFS transporter [Silvimonas iriomotensis]|uniref:MFS transporter n=1 Tax=Silvimonas iriomotensis TaxID=449662 RepID=A0ABQ2PF51_9NEIS|nr:MFS transporter [Silvimonas iriomotensis]GGP24125.1 MFS transporter [Silvimonas iriomotensis]